MSDQTSKSDLLIRSPQTARRSTTFHQSDYNLLPKKKNTENSNLVWIHRETCLPRVLLFSSLSLSHTQPPQHLRNSVHPYRMHACNSPAPAIRTSLSILSFTPNFLSSSPSNQHISRHNMQQTSTKQESKTQKKQNRGEQRSKGTNKDGSPVCQLQGETNLLVPPRQLYFVTCNRNHDDNRSDKEPWPTNWLTAANTSTNLSLGCNLQRRRRASKKFLYQKKNLYEGRENYNSLWWLAAYKTQLTMSSEWRKKQSDLDNVRSIIMTMSTWKGR